MTVSRRSVLRGFRTAAGAALLAPFFRSVARAQVAPPKRFVFITEGNCFEPITLLSDAARAAIEPTLSANHVPTDRWFSDVYTHAQTVPVAMSNLSSASALGALGADLAPQSVVVYGLSSRITGGGHTTFHGALSSSRTISARPGGITIDARIASTIAGGTPIDVLRLGTDGTGDLPVTFSICAYGAGNPAPMFVNNRAAFDALFSSVGTPQAQQQFARRRQLLDFAHSDVTSVLAVFSGSSPERAKLEKYLASVEELTLRHDGFTDLAAQLQAVRPALPDDNALYASINDPLQRFRAHLELALAALRGGMTHAVVLASGVGGALDQVYPTVLAGIKRHDLHHQSDATPQYLAAIHEVTRLQVEAIAAFARGLSDTPDIGGGSMLDNTVIVFVSENGEQHHSRATEFPALLIGGGGLGLRTAGRTLFYPGIAQAGTHRQLSNLWNTVGHLAGIDLNDFGDEGVNRVALGPLAELLV